MGMAIFCPHPAGCRPLYPNFWPALLAGLLLASAGWSYYGRTEQGRSRRDRLRLRLPFFGPFYRQVLHRSFTRSLSILLSSGVNRSPPWSWRAGGG